MWTVERKRITMTFQLTVTSVLGLNKLGMYKVIAQFVNPPSNKKNVLVVIIKCGKLGHRCRYLKRGYSMLTYHD